MNCSFKFCQSIYSDLFISFDNCNLAANQYRNVNNKNKYFKKNMWYQFYSIHDYNLGVSSCV